MQSGGKVNHRYRMVGCFAILINLSKVVLAKIFIGDSCRCSAPFCTSISPPHSLDYNPYRLTPPAPLEMPNVWLPPPYPRLKAGLRMHLQSISNAHASSLPTATILLDSNTTAEPPRPLGLHPTTLQCRPISLSYRFLPQWFLEFLRCCRLCHCFLCRS